MQVNNPVASPFKAQYLPTGRNIMGFRGRLAGMGDITDYIPSIDSLSNVLTQIGTYRIEQASIAADVEKARIAAAQKKPSIIPPAVSDVLESGAGVSTNTILLGIAGLGALYLLTKKRGR